MKRLFISAAMALFASAAFLVSAQQPTECSLPKEPAKECCKAKKCSKEKEGMLRAGAKAQPRLNLMSGIELTHEQRSKMESAREKRDAKLKKAKSDRTKKEQSIEESYQKEIKKIMTPEQYKRYEANANKIRQHREQITQGSRTVTDSASRVGEMKPGPRPQRDYNRK